MSQLNRYEFVGSFLRPERLKEARKNYELNNITKATIILNASKISSNHEGIEIIKNNTAERIYIPMNKSFLFSFTLFLLPISFHILISQYCNINNNTYLYYNLLFVFITAARISATA